MERTNFEKLKVYQQAEQLADPIWDVVQTWGRFARSTVGLQIVLAADSIPGNIAEGTGRGTLRDKQHFVRVARGSLYETKNWLRRAYRRRLLSEAQIDAIKPLVQTLAPMLNAYYRSLGRTDQEPSTKRY